MAFGKNDTQMTALPYRLAKMLCTGDSGGTGRNGNSSDPRSTVMAKRTQWSGSHDRESTY